MRPTENIKPRYIPHRQHYANRPRPLAFHKKKGEKNEELKHQKEDRQKNLPKNGSENQEDQYHAKADERRHTVMILQGYAFRDTKLNAFMLPFWAQNEDVAVRSAKHALNDPRSDFYMIRDDLELWDVGRYDDQTGAMATQEVKLVAPRGRLIKNED